MATTRWCSGGERAHAVSETGDALHLQPGRLRYELPLSLIHIFPHQALEPRWVGGRIHHHGPRHAERFHQVFENHFPGAPVMPNSLVIEGIAQTGGLLVGEHSGFEERVILAKLAKARFHFSAVPGDTLTYRATIEDIHKSGAVVSGTSHVGERLHGEVQMFFCLLYTSRCV